MTKRPLRGILANVGCGGEAYVAESDEQAIDEFAPGYEHYQAMLMATQAEWNPPDQPPPEFPKRGLKERFEYNPDKLDFFIGSAQRVRKRIADLRDAGVPNLMLTHRGGVVTAEQGLKSMHLISEEIMPHFK